MNFKDLDNIRLCLDLVRRYNCNHLINLPFDQLPGFLLSFLSLPYLKADLGRVFESFESKNLKPYIAIHVRRGDVSKNTIVNKYVPDEFYISLLKNIISSKSYSGDIHVLTQGDTQWLDPMVSLALNCKRKVLINKHMMEGCDDDEANAFFTLYNASVVFTAGSAFSELAGLLGRAKKIFDVTRSTSSCNLFASIINPESDIDALGRLIR